MNESNDGTGPRNAGPAGIAGTIDGDMQPCWLCGRSVAARALFCHGCGAVLPPRPVDHFTRLGVEQRFDLDTETLTRQHAGFTRALDPERFAARGTRQQANARAQVQAMTDAYAVLRDPVRRAGYLIERLGAGPVENDPGGDGETAALAAALVAAADAAAVDHVANEAIHRGEACIRELAVAFRSGMVANAARILARMEALDAIAAAARIRRADVAPPT